jgi:hypothetical protein
MSDITSIKPQPVAAKPNWHYDTYFLAQLKRLNLYRPDSSLKNQRKVSIKIGNREVELEIGEEADKGNSAEKS